MSEREIILLFALIVMIILPMVLIMLMGWCILFRKIKEKFLGGNDV